MTSFAHDATWAATALVGTVAGVIRGRSIGVQTDQVWGVVRPQPALDGAVIAVGVVAAALVDAVAGFLPQGTLPRQAHVAAASSLFAGYLAGRAGLGTRAARSTPSTWSSGHAEPAQTDNAVPEVGRDSPPAEDVMDAWRSSCRAFRCGRLGAPTG